MLIQLRKITSTGQRPAGPSRQSLADSPKPTRPHTSVYRPAHRKRRARRLGLTGHGHSPASASVKPTHSGTPGQERQNIRRSHPPQSHRNYGHVPGRVEREVAEGPRSEIGQWSLLCFCGRVLVSVCPSGRTRCSCGRRRRRPRRRWAAP